MKNFATFIIIFFLAFFSCKFQDSNKSSSLGKREHEAGRIGDNSKSAKIDIEQSKQKQDIIIDSTISDFCHSPEDCSEKELKYSKDCLGKNKNACDVLSKYYLSSKYFDKPEATINKSLEISCDEMKIQEACKIMANVYHLKLNNQKLARKYYGMACKLQNRKACYNLGFIYKLDKSNVKSNKRHSFYMKKSCILADTNYKYNEKDLIMHGCLEHMHNLVSEKNGKDFMQIANALCSHSGVCTILGDISLYKNEFKKFEKHYERTCQQAIPTISDVSCIALGYWELSKLNLEKAKHFFQQASKISNRLIQPMAIHMSTQLASIKKLTSKNALEIFDKNCNNSISIGCWYKDFSFQCSPGEGLTCLFTTKTKKIRPIDRKRINISSYSLGYFKYAIMLAKRNRKKSLEMFTEVCNLQAGKVISACFVKEFQF